MKNIKGWKKIGHNDSYVNEQSGQTLLVSKKEFGINYQVVLYVGRQENRKIISPEFSTEPKAVAYAIDLMVKHPYGMS